MSRWTHEQFEDYLARRKARPPIAQLPVPDEPVGSSAREEGDAARIRIRVTSFRRRLLDPDNLCPKYALDCLRYASLIPDDSAAHITLEVSQLKVQTKEGERTELEVIYP